MKIHQHYFQLMRTVSFFSKCKYDVNRALTNAADGSHCAELVDDVARQEVDVVVFELEAGEANTLTTELVQLGVLNPLHALQRMSILVHF